MMAELPVMVFDFLQGFSISFGDAIVSEDDHEQCRLRREVGDSGQAGEVNSTCTIPRLCSAKPNDRNHVSLECLVPAWSLIQTKFNP